MMTVNRFDGIPFASTVQDQDTSIRIHQTYQAILPIAANRWGLAPPDDLYIYIMTDDWFKDILSAAPRFWRIPLIVTAPFWTIRIHRMWKFVGGWQQQFGRRRVVGIKPARLLQTSNRSIGERIFIPEPDFEAKVQQIACHELTHAFTAHLRLPVWLNEGLAMVMVDQFTGKPSIKASTITSLQRSISKPGTASYRKVDLSDADTAVYIYVRGYWITRFFEETHPGLLKNLLSRRRSHKDLNQQVAQALQLEPQEFWSRIDGMVVQKYSEAG